MKRLLRKAFEQTLYHGTAFKHLQEITSSGMLLPQESVGGSSNYKTTNGFDGCTFFTNDMETAQLYSFRASSMPITDPIVVLEVVLPEDSLQPDDNDMPEAKTWQESLKGVGQVKVYGAITDNYFRNVYFYHEAGEDPIFTSNYSNWQQAWEAYKNETTIT